MTRTGKTTRTGRSGQFVIGRAAAKKIGEVEGLKMSADMDGVFNVLDRSKAQPAERRAKLAAEYGPKR